MYNIAVIVANASCESKLRFEETRRKLAHLAPFVLYVQQSINYALLFVDIFDTVTKVRLVAKTERLQ